MSARLVSLCTGYGGIELGLRIAGVDFTLRAVADPDPAAARLLTHHHPDVPNLGDLREIDWEHLQAEIITAGFPCQPVSLAGRRRGVNDERWLWDDIADGIGRMGTPPRMLLLENVPGLLSADRGDAMARVVHRLAALGYVGRYRVLRASDVGAAHRRERVFIAAWTADATRQGWEGPRSESAGCGSERGGGEADAVSLLPTPRASAAENRQTRRTPSQDAGRHGLNLAAEVCSLLPTPRASDGTNGGPNQRGSSGDLALPSAVHLLPTPTAQHDARNATAGRAAPTPTTNTSGWTLADVAYARRWGRYAPAIRRWEQATGAPAPEPTEPGKNGPRLAPVFVEWLMGLPAGHVTGVAGLSRNDRLRLLGNGVVPAQAAAAVRLLAGAR